MVLSIIRGYLLFCQHIEEETKKLKDSLEQQKQEAKSQEAELQAESSKQVRIIICVISVHPQSYTTR